MTKISFKNCFSEFLGTFGIVFFGQWLTVLCLNKKIGIAPIGLGYAATVTTFMWLGGPSATSHFNPSISLGFFVCGLMNGVMLILNLGSQLLGSFFGSLMFNFTINDLLNKTSEIYKTDVKNGIPRFDPNIGALSIIFLEFFGTFILTAFVVSLHGRKQLFDYAPAIGCLFGLLCVGLANFYSLSLNPFRVIVESLIQETYFDLLFYVIPSLIGGIVGAVFGSKLLVEDEVTDLTDNLKVE